MLQIGKIRSSKGSHTKIRKMVLLSPWRKLRRDLGKEIDHHLVPVVEAQGQAVAIPSQIQGQIHRLGFNRWDNCLDKEEFPLFGLLLGWEACLETPIMRPLRMNLAPTSAPRNQLSPYCTKLYLIRNNQQSSTIRPTSNKDTSTTKDQMNNLKAQFLSILSNSKTIKTGVQLGEISQLTRHTSRTRASNTPKATWALEKPKNMMVSRFIHKSSNKGWIQTPISTAHTKASYQAPLERSTQSLIKSRTRRPRSAIGSWVRAARIQVFCLKSCWVHHISRSHQAQALITKIQRRLSKEGQKCSTNTSMEALGWLPLLKSHLIIQLFRTSTPSMNTTIDNRPELLMIWPMNHLVRLPEDLRLSIRSLVLQTLMPTQVEVGLPRPKRYLNTSKTKDTRAPTTLHSANTAPPFHQSTTMNLDPWANMATRPVAQWRRSS